MFLFFLFGLMLSVSRQVTSTLQFATEPAYWTNFSYLDTTHWKLDNDCSSCGGHGGDECTQNNSTAVTFSAAQGMAITTTRLHAATSCGGMSLSGHATYKKALLFGNFTTIGRFFPGKKDVRSATAFIGLMSPGNVGSITIGFHGYGWKGESNWDKKFQCARYSDKSQDHERKIFNIGVSVAEQYNTYNLIWTSDRIVWSVNGVTIRTEKDASVIPQFPMTPRLHTRSGYNSEFTPGDSYQSFFKYWSYTPLTQT